MAITFLSGFNTFISNVDCFMHLMPSRFTTDKPCKGQLTRPRHAVVLKGMRNVRGAEYCYLRPEGQRVTLEFNSRFKPEQGPVVTSRTRTWTAGKDPSAWRAGVRSDIFTHTRHVSLYSENPAQELRCDRACLQSPITD